MCILFERHCCDSFENLFCSVDEECFFGFRFPLLLLRFFTAPVAVKGLVPVVNRVACINDCFFEMELLVLCHFCDHDRIRRQASWTRWISSTAQFDTTLPSILQDWPAETIIG